MQNQPSREKSPSPSFRDRQRTIKGHSAPIMPSVAQVFANQAQQPQRQDTTTTTNSYQIPRKSPPVTAQYSPPALPRANTDLPQDRPLPVPNQQAGQHSLSNPTIPMAAMHPRVQRVPAPQVIRQFEEMAESEQMTAEQLLAIIARAHETSPKEGRSDRSAPAQSHSPDRRSPVYHNEHPARTIQKSDSPPVIRKNPQTASTDLRAPTERTAQVQTRTPDRDRSLPVQEEQDDPRPHDEDDSGGGRSSRAGHRSDDQTLINTEPDNDKGGETDADAFTPRSTAPQHLPSDDQGRPKRSHSAEVMRPRTQQEDPRYHAYHDRRVLNPTQYYAHDPPRGYTPLVHPDYLDYTDIGFLQSYLSSPRPEAPIPPTPGGHDVAPSPSPSVSVHPYSPNSPVQPVGSPYPFPFSHVSRNHSYNLRQAPLAPSVDDSVRPSIIQDIKAQVAKQWNVYALNNNLEPSESAFSPSSTPGVRDDRYGPWANLHMQRTLGGPHPDLRSLQSSPSHEPLPVAPPRKLGLRKKSHPHPLSKHQFPPRVESTQPRDTSPEPSSSGEETAGEERYSVADDVKWVNGNGSHPPMPIVSIATDDTEWVDEDEEPDDDLLQLEYHPSFIRSSEKRRRKWRMQWDAITDAFQVLDQQTDATIVVLAAPSHTNKLYSLTSRSIRRANASRPSPVLSNLRSSFAQLASHRRITRSQPKTSLAAQLLSPSLDGRSDVGGDNREEELKKALEAAIGTLSNIYEQREVRWREEVKRANDEKERVELLFAQVFGSPSTSINGGSEGELSNASGKGKAT